MPATPAWPPRSTPRLYIEAELSAGMRRIDGPAAHYLVGVMRMKVGDPVKLFDDVTGEWLAVASSVSRRDLTVEVTEKLREREAVPDFWICAAPLKKGPFDWMAEKLCELGIDRFVPVVTRRTVVDHPKVDRLRTHMIEAAEQCGRTALPSIGDPMKLEALLRDWPEGRHLFFADETGGTPLSQALGANPGPAAFLIGPEGGFDNEERATIRAHRAAVPVSLGPRILRAETAAISAAAAWMAQNGDWKSFDPQSD